jgi:flagellar basal body P-ring formation protein FlgA
MYRLAALLLAIPVALPAQGFEDVDLLDRRIAVALGGTAGDAGVLAQPVDRRLKLARCPDAATIEPPVMGAVTVRCAALGWRMRVPLIAPAAGAQQGEVLVRRGDAVDLTFAGAGFAIATTATAMEDGRMGGPVRVKSPTGAAILTARVRGPGSVEISD